MQIMSNEVSFEKQNLTTKMKLYTTSEYMNNDTSFKKKKSNHKNETLHNLMLMQTFI